jgi:hypothetical protein
MRAAGAAAKEMTSALSVFQLATTRKPEKQARRVIETGL